MSAVARIIVLYCVGMPLWLVVLAARCWTYRAEHAAAVQTLAVHNGVNWTRAFVVVVAVGEVIGGLLWWPASIWGAYRNRHQPPLFVRTLPSGVLDVKIGP